VGWSSIATQIEQLRGQIGKHPARALEAIEATLARGLLPALTSRTSTRDF
jgi:hypothetical protein